MDNVIPLYLLFEKKNISPTENEIKKKSFLFILLTKFIQKGQIAIEQID